MGVRGVVFDGISGVNSGNSGAGFWCGRAVIFLKFFSEKFFGKYFWRGNNFGKKICADPMKYFY